MIEPHNAYTVLRRPVMPPKPADRILPQPEMSMAAEAVLVRARYRERNGTLTAQSSGPNANDTRKAESDARRDALAQRALELLSICDLTSGIMRNRLMVSENRMRNALGYLRKQGLADFVRKGTITIWRKLEAAG